MAQAGEPGKIVNIKHRKLPRGPRHALQRSLPMFLPLPFGRGEGRGEGSFYVAYPMVPSIKQEIVHSRCLLCRLGRLAWALILGLALGLASVNSSAWAQPYTITDLGTLPGGTTSYPTAVNNNGHIVGYGDTGVGATHAFFYSGGTLNDLGTLSGGTSSYAYGVNDSDEVVGYADTMVNNSDRVHAFIYSGGYNAGVAQGPLTDLGTLPGGYNSFAYGVNDNGLVVGSGDSATATQAAFIDAPGGAMLPLGGTGLFPHSVQSGATGINSEGEVVGEAAGMPGGPFGLTLDDAFSYTPDGTWTDLSYLGFSQGNQGSSHANAVNDNGMVVGDSQSFVGRTRSSQAFSYTTGGGMVALGTVPGGQASFSIAYGVNNSGQIVGQTLNAIRADVAFVYVNGTMNDLNTLIPQGSGWQLSVATAINASGQIVGQGTDPAGHLVGFLLTPQATVTWANPADILYGTNLSGAQLDATANVAGTFTYSPPLGTVLQAGASQTLSVSFTPSDTADYPNPVTQTVTINVNQAPLTITANPQTMVSGDPVPALTVSYSGFVNGDTSGSLTTQPTVSTTGTSSSPPGSYPISVSGADDPNYNINYVPGVLTVIPTMFALGGASVSVGSGASGSSVALTANSPNAPWTAAANAPWLHLTETSGTGGQAVDFKYDVNPGATRSGTLTIAGQTFTVIQAGSQPTTIDPVKRYAWGANTGWIDWNQGNNGAVIGKNFCSGFIYSANVGWINLGNGSPATGTSYKNDSGTDFGVNVDSSGNLRGYAWGANIGWINFETTGEPAVNPTTGKFSGYAWSANCGWINLDSTYGVATDSFYPGTTLPASQLQVLLPGETAAPGTVTGKTGTPASQIAGAPFSVAVNAVDVNFRMDSTASASVEVTSSDGAASLPGSTTLVSGTETFVVALNTPGTQEVTATDNSGLLSAGSSDLSIIPPTFSLGASMASEGSPAGGGKVSLTANAPWAATANAPWLHLTETSGTGSQTVDFTYDANPGPTRSGTLTIAGQTLTVIQAGSQPTTIDAVNRYAWGANTGWIDWNQGNNGAVIGKNFCSGFIYSANVGWINLGNGSPATGTSYKNDSGNDFGVNVDSSGNLRGYAWGANIGWINFETTGGPAVNPTTGKFSGYAWSANCGWINLNTGYGVEIAPPVPGVNNWGTAAGQSLVVPLAKMLAGASSPSGGVLSVIAVNSPSSQGGTITLDLSGGLLAYTPPASPPSPGTYPFTDQFTYTLSDTFATAIGTVSIVVSSANQQSQNGVGTISVINGQPVIGFLGIPGDSYIIQWTDSLTQPILWTSFSVTIKADSTGLISFSDPTTPVPSVRFYRTQ